MKTQKKLYFVGQTIFLENPLLALFRVSRFLMCNTSYSIFALYTKLLSVKRPLFLCITSEQEQYTDGTKTPLSPSSVGKTIHGNYLISEVKLLQSKFLVCCF